MIFKYRKRFFVLAILAGCTYLGYVISIANNYEFLDKSNQKYISDFFNDHPFGSDHFGLKSSVKSAIDIIEGQHIAESFEESQDDYITETQEVTNWPKHVNENHGKSYKKVESAEPETHEDIHNKIHKIHELQHKDHENHHKTHELHIKHDSHQNEHKTHEVHIKHITTTSSVHDVIVEKDRLKHEKKLDRVVENYKHENIHTTTVVSTTTLPKATKRELSDYEKELKEKYDAHLKSIANLPDGKFHVPDETLTDKNREFCPFELLNDDHTHDYSHIKSYFDSIRRDHFLINASPFGPNNQLRGFRDTIILAIYLNRTIVMPPFYKHRSDPSQRRPGYLYQDGSQKVDPLKLAELMPVISLKQFSEKCKHGIDVMYLAREHSDKNGWGRVNFLEKATGVPITKLRTKFNVTYFAPTVINPKSYAKHGRKEAYVYMSKSSALQAYGPDLPNSNDGPCALWNEPYRNVEFTNFLRKPEEEDYVSPPAEDMDPREIASRTMIHTPRASSIRNMVREFVKKVMKTEEYVAMHWRYDPVDFGAHCRKINYAGAACKNDLDPVSIGENLEKEILKFNNATGKKLNKVFVASPPIMGGFIKKMGQGFKGDTQLFLGTDLDEYMEIRHHRCPKEVYIDRIHDYKSLIEMELCSKSTFFLPSGSSSWSSNINQERLVRNVQKNDVGNTRLVVT